MVDFVRVAVKEKKGGGNEAYPDFVVARTKDLMVRGKNFYAVWNEALGLWSTDEYDVQRIVDDKLHSYQKENDDVVSVKSMKSFGSNSQSTFRKYMASIGDNAHTLDDKLTFLSTRVDKEDYVSKRLPYDLVHGDISAWDAIVGTLYAPEERAKIEWFLGSILSGDSKENQKFVVLEGPPGAGKGTIINIVMMLFPGYITAFDAKALGSNSNQFAAAAFENNPLVAIQHDGDLSRIEDNTILNQIVSHEVLKINQKFKPAYDARINAALLMGTNKPVKITDSQSGMIRRLIDVRPTGNLIPPTEYHRLMARIPFELGAIAQHCLDVYKKMKKGYYSNYRPMLMMFKTNAFLNFIELYHDQFEKEGGTTARRAWENYKLYCTDANIDRPMKMHEFNAELATYFETFQERITFEDGTTARNWYGGIKTQAFKMPAAEDDVSNFVLRLDETTSLLNLELAEWPAQYAKADGSPSKYWDDGERLIGGVLKRPRLSQIVDTLLQDLDPTREHYVKVPENLICIDFDLKDADGNDSLERCLAEASTWPSTYAELSRSGNGVHLHYYYEGDLERLDPNFGERIEVKRYSGNSALRRRLTRCNNVPIATLTVGQLPLKEKKRVLDPHIMQNEKGLRSQIEQALRKEVHAGTKSNIDFINWILEQAYEEGIQYDVTDLRQRITVFAMKSSNQPTAAFKVVQGMRWKSETAVAETSPPTEAEIDTRLVFYDLEVYPNLFVFCWKFQEEPGVEPSKDNVVRLINPKPHEVESMMSRRLVGFNNRGYDNHILWAAALGANNAQLYLRSKKLIGNIQGARFGEAYRIGWTDVLDYSTDKKKLKKWQIDLGINHQEMDIPWDEPVPDDRIEEVLDYCANDVVTLEVVHNHLSGDYNARLFLADMAGMTPNDTTAQLTAGIIFGREKNPQRNFIYTRLQEQFPGYVFEGGKSTYKGVTVGEGGYVFGKPGLYTNVVLLDVASMHPTSIGQLNLFGEYTPRYMALVEGQLALKNSDFEKAKTLMDGKLRPYVERIEKLAETDPEAADKARLDLRQGLKIAMNIVYGLTSAAFDNPFRDTKNVDNIVAKRGALFMIDLKEYIEDVLGLVVVHIKTDSVKVPDVSEEDIRLIQTFAKKYGYDMEHEATFDKFGLVNDAVYVAHYAAVQPGKSKKSGWTATGKEFQIPYVFKKCFGLDEQIVFADLCETKNVLKGEIRMDFGIHEDGDLGFVDGALAAIKDAEKRSKAADKAKDPEMQADAATATIDALKAYDRALEKLIFVGKIGQFTPVKPGFGGGQVWRVFEGRAYAIAGTKGYLWVESSVAKKLPGDAIDYSYFEKELEDSRDKLDSFLVGSPFSSVAEFLS